ncbi:A1 cistron-splicing factor [Blyttiomyces helicus]|uniref:A1 cistron-splicing factor n=1 Tax=Blyttiomyces helicus TaxID=388810 RepID=A0A4P9W8N6_9FUNG|nr:A1 cistron-splicing factor [Blyttiomyces helicus]|eukprot:RKO88492.1 A1 cistron-splicing factor [Blyttiomyces helicus]
MDQETANALFDKGAFLLFLDAPENLEFGIDLATWTVGPRFKGIKIIPPGLHFVYYSGANRPGQSGGVRSGFFKFFESQEIVVKRWDEASEDVFPDSAMDLEQLGRYRLSKSHAQSCSSVRRVSTHIRDFDANLGIYPLTATAHHPTPVYPRWLKLCSRISTKRVGRVLPSGGILNAAEAESRFSENGLRAEPKGKGPAKVDQHALRIEFALIDLKKSFPVGATGSDVTKYSLDKSFLLRKVLQDHFENDHKELLGELQLSFIIFLVGQTYDGFEQWKTLVQLICMSEEALETLGNTLFVEFVECPEDFFTDAITSDSFLRASLVSLVANARARPQAPPALRSAIDGLVEGLLRRFRWDLMGEVRLREGADDEEAWGMEEGEDAPVVVEL